MANCIAIAVDGPASSGKSTISRNLAKELDFIHIDTGAMYRSLTWAAIQEGVSFSDQAALVQLLNRLEIDFKLSADRQLVFVNGKDRTRAIRSNEVTRHSSEVAAHPLVREELVDRQRQLAQDHNVIMDGRDIGTVVLDQADYKFFLDASVEERARRRFNENRVQGSSQSFDQLKKELAERDKKDRERAIAPLKAADDAYIIDTTDLSIEEVQEKMKNIIKKD